MPALQPPKAALSAALMLIALAACGGDDGSAMAIRDEPGPAFNAIGADETLRFYGAEGAWQGSATGNQLQFRPAGANGSSAIPVKRFAGNNGIGLTGEWNGEKLRMAVTPGECRDAQPGMAYPYVVTLRLGEETSFGCAATDSAPEKPLPSDPNEG